MRLTTKTAALALAFNAGRPLRARFSFTVGGRPVQIHSFLSQGFGYFDHNNYQLAVLTFGT